MADLVLKRFVYVDQGVFGTMEVGGQTLYTVEEHWNDNKTGDSCIPVGTYKCVPRMYNKGGYMAILVTGVPGRDLILFHAGNTTDDIDGCIAPGLRLGGIAGRWGVSASKKAFAHLMKHFGGKEFTLQIVNEALPFPDTSQQ